MTTIHQNKIRDVIEQKKMDIKDSKKKSIN